MADSSIMRYTLVLQDGSTYRADTKLGLVKVMKKGWWNDMEISKSEYKSESSDRIFQLYNLHVDKTKFIDSLVDNKLAKLIEIGTA
jgi:hypothetical protein